jgi:hypothetical protein
MSNNKFIKLGSSIKSTTGATTGTDTESADISDENGVRQYTSSALQKLIKKYDADLGKHKRKTDKALSDIERGLLNVKEKNFEMLSVFVALFTFVSLEFSVFRSTDKSMLVPLSLVVLGGVILFVLLLTMLFNTTTDNGFSLDDLRKRHKNSKDLKRREKSMEWILFILKPFFSLKSLFMITSIVILVGGFTAYREALDNRVLPSNACARLASNASDAYLNSKKAVFEAQQSLYSSLGCSSGSQGE